MKSSRQVLLLGLAVAMVLASCTAEKRLYSSGYHIEWMNGKHSPDKNAASAEAKRVEERQVVKEEQSVATTSEAENSSAAAEETIVASDDNNVVVLTAPKTATVNKTVSPVKTETRKEVKTAVKQVVKKAKAAKAAGAGSGDKSWIATLLLCIFLGGIGIHRFYLGYTWQGVVQLLTAGGCGVWALIDLVRIIIRDLEPKNGNYKD